MTDYEDLGHMKRVHHKIESPKTYVLPHHAVIRPDSNKLLVVYDASQQTAGGKSLNDFLNIDSRLQKDITTILLCWGTFQHDFTADIIKIAHQRICLTHRYLRHRLCAVSRHPSAQAAGSRRRRAFSTRRAALTEHTYVNDILTLKEAQRVKTEVQAILGTAGMHLDQWAANNNSLLLDGEHVTSTEVNLCEMNSAVSTLGLRWRPHTDCFQYQLQRRDHLGHVAKRIILGEVARLYDLRGWLAPIVVRAKMLLQLLWITGDAWDVPVKPEIAQRWMEFREQLSSLERLRIPRWVRANSNNAWTLHGFSDASEKAYAAALYRVIDPGTPGASSSLLAAKSKVAPVKTQSLPRLELCGALLLCRLMHKILGDLQRTNLASYCWWDSQVVLAWLRCRPNSWKTFVANRVCEILTTLPSAHWRHVKSALKPAGLATWGMILDQLAESSLWWNGSSFIREAEDSSETYDVRRTMR